MRYLIAKKTEEKVSFQSNGKTRDYSEIAIGQIRSLLGGGPSKTGKKVGKPEGKQNNTTQNINNYTYPPGSSWQIENTPVKGTDFFFKKFYLVNVDREL